METIEEISFRMAEQDQQNQRGTGEAAPGTWEAVNLGSGTFLIKKPKRKSNKVHQVRARNPRRGSRK